MDIILWGVRGSIPSPALNTHFYGANTPCIELRTSANDLLIFDAGSGIRLLGDSLPAKGECHIFITHGHTDHTGGLGFFKPFYRKNWTINLYIPDFLSDLEKRYFDGGTFPVEFDALEATIITHTVKANEPFTIKSKGFPVTIETFSTNHPGQNIAYKVLADNSIFCYSGDHEITQDKQIQEQTKKFLYNADVAVVDAMFNKNDYIAGWGHSAWEDWIELATAAGVKNLILSHHSPDRDDLALDALHNHLKTLPTSGPFVCVAREGIAFGPDTGSIPRLYTSNWLQDFIDTTGQYKEERIILDSILKKTREFTNADAGTVFLMNNDELVFAYTHNDSLFPANESSKYAYASIRIPCSVDSLAGYAAVTGKILNIPDVRKLPSGAPYHFNDSFDKKTGYHTKSVLTIPLIGKNQRLMGVLQLINSLNPRDKTPQPFSIAVEKVVKTLAMEASKVLEISSTVCDNIYRLLRIASLHDPMETGPHAERVGAIASEIYRVWSQRYGILPDEALNFRSHLRLAAMLHDIGKVGISDSVLKKPGKLTFDEFEYIKTHATKGAELFASQPQDISELAYDITMHHHQKWNGKGYGPLNQPPLSGADIPLAARITAIADVFDALLSPRCYKDAWPFYTAVDLIKSESGKHFDPELVDCFIEILDTVLMIYRRFPETTPFLLPDAIENCELPALQA